MITTVMVNTKKWFNTKINKHTMINTVMVNTKVVKSGGRMPTKVHSMELFLILSHPYSYFNLKRKWNSILK